MTPHLANSFVLQWKWENSATQPLSSPGLLKIRAVYFAPASSYNDMLFLAKSLPAISCSACSNTHPTPTGFISLLDVLLLPPATSPSPQSSSLSSQGRNMSFYFLHATVVRGGFESQAKGGWRTTGALSHTIRMPVYPFCGFTGYTYRTSRLCIGPV